MRPFDSLEERELVARAKEGDVEAFEFLVRRFQGSIYGLCYRLTGVHQSADDLSQETFIKAYFALSQFHDGLSFFTWIRRIAINNCLNHLRAGKREEPLGEKENRVPGNSGSSPGSPQDELLRNRMEQDFAKALRALPSKLRAVFVLRVFDDLNYREIAQVLDIPEGTVMSRLNRARQKLKTRLAHYLSRRGR